MAEFCSEFKRGEADLVSIQKRSHRSGRNFWGYMLVGLKTAACVDPHRLNWDGTAARPLAWTAWYPADQRSVARVPLETSWFRKEPVAVNAPVARSNNVFPLVILSHGTAATGAALEWLGSGWLRAALSR